MGSIIVNGNATSIKSIDLTSKSYQSATKLFGKIKEYVNDLASFNGKNWGGVNISADQITSRTLEIAIQPGKASVEQWEALSKAVKYSKEMGVNFVIQYIK